MPVVFRTVTELEPDVLDLEVGNVANGGFCVARHEGRVVFVRHALPGERVRARVTDRTKNFLRADAVEIIEASPDRVEPPCPFAGPGRCGGCDWQHASLPAQRALKAAVVEEQLRRLAGITRTVVVEEVPYPVEGDVAPPRDSAGAPACSSPSPPEPSACAGTGPTTSSRSTSA